jgi:DNA helicase HerA-like ATPase
MFAMSDELLLREKMTIEENSKLDNTLQVAEAFVKKYYLEDLEFYSVSNVTQKVKHINYNDNIRLYRIQGIVINNSEKNSDCLNNIYSALHSLGVSVIMLLNSDGNDIELYMGIRSQGNILEDYGNMENVFSQLFKGNFPGCKITQVDEDVYNSTISTILPEDGKNAVTSLTSLPALKDEDTDNQGFTQGLEKFVDAMQNEKFAVIIISDPISSGQVENIKQGYEELYSELYSFAETELTLGKTDSVNISKSEMEGYTETIGKSVSKTQSFTKGFSKTKSESRTNTIGVSMGMGGNVGVSSGQTFSKSVNAGVGPKIVNIGGSIAQGVMSGVSSSLGLNVGVSSSTAKTQGTADTWMENTQHGTGETLEESKARSMQNSIQKGLSYASSTSSTVKFENKTIKNILDCIDSHLERLKECGNYGMWSSAAYFISPKKDTSVIAASAYKGVLNGEKTELEQPSINTWYRDKNTITINEYLRKLCHPKFYDPDYKVDLDALTDITATTMISTKELTLQCNIPYKSIPGVTVIPMASFGRNLVETSNDIIELGALYHMGHNEGKKKVKLDLQSLTMHTFITGSTGSGKSTTIYSLLDKLKDNGIKFMVVEPAKGEYKDRFGGYNDVAVYGTNNKKMPLLRINPFSFPKDVHVLEHIDRLVDIFNVCWPMYAAMPAVLKDSIERAYEVSGWNLESSECRYCDDDGNALFPTFEDVLNQINVVMNESAYSSDSKGDYKGALCTRLKSLTNGLYRQIFTPDELSGEELFDSNVIVDLSRTGSSETKSLIMGLLVLKLQEYRMSNATGTNAKLKHVTVLEEAHNILKRTSTEQSSETANLTGKSVEMIGNSIAEMRTYGEGFIIADQAPGLMDMSVIRNTNTKIILRLPDYEDRELVGRAANLNDEQIGEVSRLENFVAAVYQNNWLEPVLCKVDTNFKSVSPYKYDGGKVAEIDKRGIVEYLLIPFDKRDEFVDLKDKLVRDIFKLPIATEMKVGFIRYTESQDKDETQQIRSKIIYQLFNSDNVFRLAKSKEKNVDLWLKCMRDNLEPAISYMEEVEQNKVVANLILERNRIDGSRETSRLFERFMNFI